MGIVYPDDFDFFNVPTLPEETSLSSAGTALRNHTELHNDINLAVMALQSNAALKTHDHSGVDGIGHGPKLSQANTHQNADTDTSPTALHHTLGAGANQAAPGNHTHAELPQNYRICTSSTRPTPFPGLMIFETDTNIVRVWAVYEGSTNWHVVFGNPRVTPVINNYTTVVQQTPPPPLPTAVCRLRQGKTQVLDYRGTILEWHEETEDPYNFFNPAASLTSITIRQAGLYQIDCAIQWDTQVVPDVANVVLCINGVETVHRTSQFIRGNGFKPGFSQTVSVSGKLRFEKDQVLTVKVSYEAPALFQGRIFSYVEQLINNILPGDQGSKVASRIDIVNVGA